jgi:hypothetical protein
VDGSSESSNKPLGFIKCRDVLEWLHSCSLSCSAQLHRVSYSPNILSWFVVV